MKVCVYTVKSPMPYFQYPKLSLPKRKLWGWDKLVFGFPSCFLNPRIAAAFPQISQKINAVKTPLFPEIGHWEFAFSRWDLPNNLGKMAIKAFPLLDCVSFHSYALLGNYYNFVVKTYICVIMINNWKNTGPSYFSYI